MVAARLATAQACLGHDVTIVCYETADDAGTLDFPHPKTGTPPRIERLGPVGSVERIVARRAREALRRIVPECDVVHLHGVWGSALAAAGGVARACGTPYVIVPHGVLDKWALTVKPWKKRLALAVHFRRFVQGASMIHALSLYEAECVREWGFDGRIEIIPNGGFEEEFDPLPEPGRFHAKHPELEGEPFILFLSRLHPVKRLDLLAEAMPHVLEALPRTRLVVVGPDYGAQADFEAQIERLGIADRVHLTGPVWGREKYEAMIDATCFTLPSQHEAFSVAIIEALACYCPVVISESCHFPEVEEADAGEVVPLDVERLAGALVRVLSDEPHRRRMAEHGRRLAIERFTWPRIAERTVALYADLGASRGRGAQVARG